MTRPEIEELIAFHDGQSEYLASCDLTYGSDKHRDTTTALRSLLEEVERLRGALRLAESAISASYLQAIAEGAMHDKAADRHDAVVQQARKTIRALLKETTHD